MIRQCLDQPMELIDIHSNPKALRFIGENVKCDFQDVINRIQEMW